VYRIAQNSLVALFFFFHSLLKVSFLFWQQTFIRTLL